MKLHHSLLAIVVLLCQTVAAQGQTILALGHVDVGINYVPGNPSGQRWDLHVHDEDGGVEYPPNQAILRALPASRTTRPSGTQWDFIGSPAGTDIWVLPQTQNPNVLFLGIGAEELGPGVFVGNTVNLRLKALSGPGQFSLWTENLGTPTVRMASSDGITAADTLQVIAGSHGHFNWGFTAPGDYLVTFEGFGTPVAAGGDPSSGDVVYRFNVSPIPEPSTLCLTTLVAGGALAARWRRLRRDRVG